MLYPNGGAINKLKEFAKNQNFAFVDLSAQQGFERWNLTKLFPVQNKVLVNILSFVS
jgi:hypothetical protein